MKKTLLTLLIVVGIFGANQIIYADTSTLFISPASLNIAVGKTFNVSVQLNPANNKVCVVKGTLSFDNLSCQSIIVSSGLMAQVAPSCADPSFIIGIPKCATTNQSILSASVKGIKAGQESLSFTGVKIVGAGMDIPFNVQSSVYNIAAVKTTSPKTTPIAESATTTVKLFDIILNIESVLLNKSSDLIAKTQFMSFGTVPTPVNMVYKIEDVSGKEIFTEKDEAIVETEQLVTKEFKNLDIGNGKYTLVLATTYGDNVKDEFKQVFEVRTSILKLGIRAWFWIVLGLVIAGIVGFIIYLFIKRKKRGLIN